MSEEVKKSRKRDLEKQKGWSKDWREKNKPKDLKIHSVVEEDKELLEKIKKDENLTSSEAFHKVMNVYRNHSTIVR